MSTAKALTLHPDRLLPADPTSRAIARRLYATVRELPILSPHGHVDPRLLLNNEPLPDPTALFITPDHYVTRLLHASGIGLDELGVGQRTLSETAARRAWRLLCENWDVFRGTPVRYWFEAELVDIFAVKVVPSAQTADTIYDHLCERLAEAAFRPRALLDRFRVEVLATTDDPAEELSAHAALAADDSVTTRILPTFRPDRYLEPIEAAWVENVDRLGAAANIDVTDYAGYLRALAARRRYFLALGATSADHSHADVRTEPLTTAEATRIYDAARRRTATNDELIAFRRHMLFEMARMSVEDGLVMTLHPAVRRSHHAPTAAAFGTDTGQDIPLAVEFTDALRPLLDRFGTAAGFHLVLFTIDETVFSREIAPLAGFYPTVFAGAPWWFLDAPDAIGRYRAAVTETAGFSRTSGFVDDTRALCSIPARHDMSRRLDSGYLARLVAEHQLDEDEALETITELVTVNPRRAFKL
ncbi:MAG: glucuronate isomerase [Jatrophihabitantaceae bacterium]